MATRHGHPTGVAHVHWLSAGAVLVGLGAAMTAGQGVAAALPSESTDSHSPSSASEAGTPGSEGDTNGAGVDGGAQPQRPGPGSAPSGSPSDRQTSTVSSPHD